MQYNQVLQGHKSCLCNWYLHAVLCYLAETVDAILWEFFFRTTWNPRWIPRKSQDYIHNCNYLYIVRIVLFRTNNDIPSLWHLSMTHNYWFTELLDNAMSLILLLTISLLNLKRVVTMASIAPPPPPPWHEPYMVHVRLLFLQPDLYDVHSCSLLFVGELDELQHWI